jgi:aspartate ammonia-lyase
MVKKAAAMANVDMKLIPKEIGDCIVKACDDIIAGEFVDQFVVDMIQGGAGTSTNMNANEVIANRALEHMGEPRGNYTKCHPNDHVNRSQSTNDSYPTAVKLAVLLEHVELQREMRKLVAEFRRKAHEFKDILKMGRTQLQDGV